MKLRVLSLPLMLMILAYSCNAQAAHKGTLTWGASPSSGATYTVYRAPATKNSDGTFTPGTFAQVASGVSALTYVDTPLNANSSFCWQVTATAPSMSESTPLGPACGITNKDQTSSPTGSLGLAIQ